MPRQGGRVEPKKRGEPYKPAYTGFDVERTENAQRTHERAQEGAAAKGEHLDAEYLEKGPAEYRRRTGEAEEE